MQFFTSRHFHIFCNFSSSCLRYSQLLKIIFSDSIKFNYESGCCMSLQIRFFFFSVIKHVIGEMNGRYITCLLFCRYFFLFSPISHYLSLRHFPHSSHLDNWSLERSGWGRSWPLYRLFKLPLLYFLTLIISIKVLE